MGGEKKNMSCSASCWLETKKQPIKSHFLRLLPLSAAHLAGQISSSARAAAAASESSQHSSAVPWLVGALSADIRRWTWLVSCQYQGEDSSCTLLPCFAFLHTHRHGVQCRGSAHILGLSLWECGKFSAENAKANCLKCHLYHFISEKHSCHWTLFQGPGVNFTNDSLYFTRHHFLLGPARTRQWLEQIQ